MSMWSCPIGISAAAGNPTRDTWTSCLSQCRAVCLKSFGNSMQISIEIKNGGVICKSWTRTTSCCHWRDLRTVRDDSLNLSLKKHRTNKGYTKFESWNETICRNQDHIKEIEHESLLLLHEQCIDTDRKIVNTNSTGKDSMVVNHLVKKSGIDCETYFNVTTLDVAESNQMAKRNRFKHIYPDPQYGGFYKYVHDSGIIPTRFARFCCTYFKEKPTVDYFPADEKILFLFGIRNEESSQRSNYNDITKNPMWGDRDWIGVLPIRKWTELDIWLYILSEGIEVNPKYKYGYTRVDRLIVATIKGLLNLV